MQLTDYNHTVTDEFVFFFGGPFSQWAKCSFEVAGKMYNCAEQYMMAQKALFFKDLDIYEQIMASSDPRKQKALGRKVKNFDMTTWLLVCEDIVFTANVAKFTQDQDLYEVLISSENRMLVEASPYDTVWGIGLAEDDRRSRDLKQWRGTNLLGIALMRVRGTLQRKL